MPKINDLNTGCYCAHCFPMKYGNDFSELKNARLEPHKLDFQNMVTWEDIFETTTSEVSNNPDDALKGLNNYWKSKTEL